MSMKNIHPPKCSECDATTKQFLRGWEEGYDKYLCGHCKNRYKIESKANDPLEAEAEQVQLEAEGIEAERAEYEAREEEVAEREREVKN